MQVRLLHTAQTANSGTTFILYFIIMKKFIFYSLGFLALFTGLVVMHLIFTGIQNQTLFFIASFEFFSFTALLLVCAKQYKF